MKRSILFSLASASFALYVKRKRKDRPSKATIQERPSSTSTISEPSTTLIATTPSREPESDDNVYQMIFLFLLMSAAVWMGRLVLFDRQQISLEALVNSAAPLYTSLGLALVAFVVAMIKDQKAQTEQSVPPQTISSRVKRSDIADFGGTWIKDPTESGSPDKVMDLMHIGPIMRHGVKLMKGLEIIQTKTSLQLAVLTVIPFLKTIERYSLDGSPSFWKRRDLRRGLHTGHLEWDAKSKTLFLFLEWNSPFPGKGCEAFHLLSKSKLRVRSTLYADDKTVSYDTIYKKS